MVAVCNLVMSICREIKVNLEGFVIWGSLHGQEPANTLSWYLYYIVTQNMMRTQKGKYLIFFGEGDPNLSTDRIYL